jgi:hypothetical protein
MFGISKFSNCCLLVCAEGRIGTIYRTGTFLDFIKCNKTLFRPALYLICDSSNYTYFHYFYTYFYYFLKFYSLLTIYRILLRCKDKKIKEIAIAT